MLPRKCIVADPPTTVGNCCSALCVALIWFLLSSLSCLSNDFGTPLAYPQRGSPRLLGANVPGWNQTHRAFSLAIGHRFTTFQQTSSWPSGPEQAKLLKTPFSRN
jgi:hypothetical protein